MGNTIEWELKRVRKNPTCIPKIRTQAKKLSTLLGGILEKSVGETSMLIANGMVSQKDIKRKIGDKTLEKAGITIERKKLILEKVLVLF